MMPLTGDESIPAIADGRYHHNAIYKPSISLGLGQITFTDSLRKLFFSPEHSQTSIRHPLLKKS